MRAACSPPVEGLTTLPAMPPTAKGGPARLRTDDLLTGDPAVDSVIAAVDRGPLGLIPIDRLGDGELRFLALALVLLTGPGVLDVDTSSELLPAGQVLTVLADGLDQGLDAGQAREVLRLAGLAAGRGHIRLLGTVRDPSVAEGVDGISVTRLGGRRGADQGDAVDQSG
jgi:hypothetical protein